MFDLPEMLLWSVPEVQARVRELLPAGWTCVFGGGPPFEVKILDDIGKERFRSESYDERLAAFDAFGHLDAMRHPASTSGPWARRTHELTSRIVRQEALDLPDPEDLDPTEISAVYSRSPGGRS